MDQSPILTTKKTSKLTKAILIIISNLIILVIGFFVGYSMNSGSGNCPVLGILGGSSKNSYQAGFDAARTKLEQSGLLRPEPEEIFTISGKISAVTQNKITIKANPTVPLNSLMVHGIGHGQSYQGKTYSHTPDGKVLDMNLPANLQDFREEIADYFSQGFNLQELYITPSLMTQGMWDVLAEGANWAHANHDVLLDAHFIGANLTNADCGQTGNGNVYGVASWSERKAILMLRNPSYNTAKTITLDPQQAFDVPPYFQYNGFTLTDNVLNTKPGAPMKFDKGQSITFTVQPRSILLYEAIPYGTSIFNSNQAFKTEAFCAKITMKNSARKAIQISFGKIEEGVEINLISANGRILAKNRAVNTKQASINIEGISNGLYFLRLSNARHTLIKKVCIAEL